MRLLVDANLAPVVAARLGTDHDAVHVADVGLLHSADDEILEWAATEDRIVVSADGDVGALLATRRLSRPSFVLLRSADDLAPDQQADLLLANLPHIEEDLTRGAIASLARGRLRVRALPVTG